MKQLGSVLALALLVLGLAIPTMAFEFSSPQDTPPSAKTMAGEVLTPPPHPTPVGMAAPTPSAVATPTPAKFPYPNAIYNEAVREARATPTCTPCPKCPPPCPPDQFFIIMVLAVAMLVVGLFLGILLMARFQKEES